MLESFDKTLFTLCGQKKLRKVSFDKKKFRQWTRCCHDLVRQDVRQTGQTMFRQFDKMRNIRWLDESFGQTDKTVRQWEKRQNIKFRATRELKDGRGRHDKDKSAGLGQADKQNQRTSIGQVQIGNRTIRVKEGRVGRLYREGGKGRLQGSFL